MERRREVEVDRLSSGVGAAAVVGTGGYSSRSTSEDRNTSSGGTLSPNVRTTRAILRLRASARLGSIGVVGVMSTSAFGERGVACAWGSDDDRGAELKRMIGRRAPLGHGGWTSTTNGTADSYVDESDVLRRDSFEEDAARESEGSGKLSELEVARDFSQTE